MHPIQETGKRPTAALDRNLAYLGLVEVLYGYPLDGVVLTIGCDKTTPALLMAAATVNIPAIALSVGPMLNGWYDGERTGSGTIDLGGARAARRGRDRLRRIHRAGRRRRASSVGYCNTMGTATTMNCAGRGARHVAARLRRDPGALPRARADGLRDRPAHRRDGARGSEAVGHPDPRRPSRTRSCVNSAIGGSTNAPIHLNAIARHVGVELAIEDWQRLGHDVPLLVNLQPAGEYPRRGLPPRRRRAGGGRRADRGRAAAASGRAHRQRPHASARTAGARRPRPRGDPALRPAAEAARPASSCSAATCSTARS